jgi:hypothetical protein
VSHRRAPGDEKKGDCAANADLGKQFLNLLKILFAQTSKFRRRNLQLLKKCFEPYKEAEEKHATRTLEDMPQYFKSGGA